MLPTAIVWFRETLEIAIILGIIAAATRGVVGAKLWILLGVVGGVVGSIIVAFFADHIAESLNGMGQEVFNAIILFTAAIMIAWTAIWMQKHGREIASKMKQVGQKVKEGESPLYSVAIVIALAMWREGSEIAIFTYSIVQTTTDSAISLVASGFGGAVAALLIGGFLYEGLVHIPAKYMLRVSGWLLILIACGMNAIAANYLVMADMLPSLGAIIWDTSGFISQESLFGRILHAMVGYTDRPSGMQLLVYVASMAILIFAMKIYTVKPPLQKLAQAS